MCEEERKEIEKIERILFTPSEKERYFTLVVRNKITSFMFSTNLLFRAKETCWGERIGC